MKEKILEKMNKIERNFEKNLVKRNKVGQLEREEKNPLLYFPRKGKLLGSNLIERERERKESQCW